MKKYKVEFQRAETFVVDVLAKNKKEAKILADMKWTELEATGTEYYHQIGDTRVEIGNIYDVTNTDDPFNP